MTPLARRLLIAFAALFAVYTLAGFFIAPPLIRSAILANLDKTLTTKASLRRVRVNPLALSLTLEGLEIPDSGGTSAVSFSKLYLRFSIFSPFFRAWTLTVAAQGQWLDGIAARVRSSIAVSPDEVTALANDRARRIQGYLLQDTTLTADRLFIVANKSTYAPDSAGVRAGLTLRD
jgi:hypothetical protein